MSVYFVYRTTYGAPLERHVRRFDDDTVLAWARRVYQPIADGEQAYEHAKALLGGLEVYTFERVFTGPAEDGTPPPRTMKGVTALFEHMYQGEIQHGRHHLQVLTDDDETEMAVYLFDDHYRAANPGKTDWLLHEGWELPAGDAAPEKRPLARTRAYERRGDGEGRLYGITLAAFDSGNLTDLSSQLLRLDGVRLDGLCRYLLTGPEEEDGLGADFQGLRESLVEVLGKPGRGEVGFFKALREEPGDRVHWGAYSDWLQDHGRPIAGLHLLERALRHAAPDRGRNNRDPKRDLHHVTPHLAQAAKHEGSWPEQPFMWFTPHHTWETWIFFDDRWAAAQPALAAGLVRFATRWDVL